MGVVLLKGQGCQLLCMGCWRLFKFMLHYIYILIRDYNSRNFTVFAKWVLLHSTH